MLGFLLAQLYLDSLFDKTTPKAIRLALKQLQKEREAPDKGSNSKAIDCAYAQAMGRIEGQAPGLQKLAKQVLSWITCARRPLATIELRHAIALEVGESELDEENVPEIEDMVSVCAGLVTVDKKSDIIRLVHYTTQDYFERTQRDWFPDAETDITEICVTYLSFDIFSAGFCSTDKEFEARLQQNPLYDYASRNWGQHACATSAGKQLIVDFLKSEEKVSSSSQAMMVSRGFSGYSQDVPMQMIGVHLAAYFGLREVMEALLQNGHELNAKDSYYQTPLSWAAKNGHEAVVKLLLEKDAELESDRGRTPLSLAAEKGHEAIVKLLLKNAELEPKDFHGRTSLTWAAKYGHLVVVKLLLEKGADLECKTKYGLTPLSRAAAEGHKAVVELLLEKGAELESKDIDGRTPLLWAVGIRRGNKPGQEAIVKLLLEEGAELETKTKHGQTPLSLAAEKGNEAIVKVLLEKGADIQTTYMGQTPRWWAVRNGHEAVVKLLLEKDGGNLSGSDMPVLSRRGPTRRELGPAQYRRRRFHTI